MPTYRITAPDGRVFRVNGPEGSTREQALEQVKATYAAKGVAPGATYIADPGSDPDPSATDGTPDPSADAARAYSLSGRGEDAGYLEQLAGGAKHSLDRAAMGLKGLFTDLTPEDKALLDQGKSFVEKTGPTSSIGEFAGDVAITAPIGGAMLKAGQAARAGGNAAVRLIKALTAASGSSAATAALVSPEDRVGGAVAGALGGLAGEGGGRLLTKTLSGPLRGMVSPGARKMIDEGVTPPIWKSTDNKVVRSTAEAAKGLPIVGAMMKGQERKAVEEWNRNLVKKVTPPSPVLDEAGGVLRWGQGRPAGSRAPVGTEAISDLSNRFGQSYDALYSGRHVPIDDTFETGLNDIVSRTESYVPSIAADIRGAAQRVRDTVLPGTERLVNSGILDEAGNPIMNPGRAGSGVTYDAMRRARMELDDAINSAWNAGDSERARALDALRKHVTDTTAKSLPPEVAAAKTPIDKAYTGYKRLQRAGASIGAARNEGVISPGQLLSASKALDKTPGKLAFSKGNAAMQQEALAAEKVFGSELPEVGPGTAEKVLFGLGGLTNPLLLPFMVGASRPGQKALMGGYKSQDAVLRHADAIVNALRSGGLAGSIQE